MKSGIIFFIFSIIFCIKTALCVDFAFYCKCYCPPNSTIVKVKDCTVCNKNLCIEQRLCVFQNSTTVANNSTTSSNKPRSIQELNQYSLVKSSLVTYGEYLYASLFGRVKRDFMLIEDEEINKEKRKIGKNVDGEEENDSKKDEKEEKEDDNKEDNNKEKEEDNKEEENKEDNNKEDDSSSDKSTNSTDTNDQAPEESESVINIIESGTDDGYQKSEEENWMTECFKRGSIKDEAIILLFLGSTGILLTYAIMKKYFANNYEDAMKYNYTTLNNNSN